MCGFRVDGKPIRLMYTLYDLSSWCRTLNNVARGYTVDDRRTPCEAEKRLGTAAKASMLSAGARKAIGQIAKGTVP